MAIRAGFAEVDITPEPGVAKIGWIKNIISEEVLDPLYARACVFESGGEQIIFVQLDTLVIKRPELERIRAEAEAQHGVPGDRIMVSATHNHAGPAIADAGEVVRDDAYVAIFVEKVIAAIGQALAGLQEVEVGFGSTFEFDVAHNRRIVMRDGTVRTHGSFNDPGALYIEGPIDPEVAVVAVKAEGGDLLGALVNFACHPTHHGPGPELSAGYPGVLAAAMKQRGCPVTMFLNGTCGNLHTANPSAGGKDPGMETAGNRLADDVSRVLADMTYRDSLRLASRSAQFEVPFREVTDDQVKGTALGAQRFVDPTLYDRLMPQLIDRIRREGAQRVEVQVHFLDEYAVVSLPGEIFVQFGLRIKQRAYPRHALTVSCTNGHVGYVPHKEAFDRGGYETTFGSMSCLAPDAGDRLVDAALALIRQEPVPEEE